MGAWEHILAFFLKANCLTKSFFFFFVVVVVVIDVVVVMGL